MEPNEYKKIPAEKFEFAQLDTKLRDEKFETKPIGYFKDAWIRFKKNKASLIAAIIILLIVVFSIVTPFVSKFQMSDVDGFYKKARPKSEFFSEFGFWNGGYEKKLNDRFLIYLYAMGMAAEDTEGTGDITWEQAVASEWSPILEEGDSYEEGGNRYRNSMVDSYLEVGFKYLSMTETQYDEIKAWEEETGIQVIYPMVDIDDEFCADPSDANYWYRQAPNGAPLAANGKRMSLEDVQEKGLIDNYLRDSEGNVLDYLNRDKTMRLVRVLYYNYYYYTNGHTPTHLLGSDGQGYDILVRLAMGVRLSLVLAVAVSVLNLTIGTIYGAVEGFYGGWVDMTLERVSDILSGFPFVIVATLFQLHLVATNKVSPLVGLLFAFVVTGWLGTAYSVRTQFYSFKNQEYILAARTLGARDRRLMFKHIFPNAIGTIITSSVLVIPGVIFEESFMSYLGIVNFNGRNLTSLGTMLSNGQGYLSTDPHIILFPALIISLLMISFNLFGNGLRDAFNPSLRGAED